MSDQGSAAATSGSGSGLTRRDLLRASGSALALAASLPASFRTAAAIEDSAPPHIVYILADDLGWKDVGFHGSDIKTPHLDRLAATGARLEQFYVEPMCTPTRAALLTGRYPLRYGLQTGVIPAGAVYGLPTDEWLLPETLREAGYKTVLVGKWHLGHGKTEYWPKQRGFDNFYGCLVGEIDHFEHESHGVVDWYRDNQLDNQPGYDTTLFGAEAVRVIAEHDPSTPLFMYLAFTAAHTPYQAPAEYLDLYPEMEDSARRAYAGMISAMDHEIGRVVEALEARNMRENTLIVFHSDNGGTRSNMFTGDSVVTGELPPDNGPYRDGKGTLYEGGTRVVSLANWPGRIAAGPVEGMLHVVDMYPTLAGLAGAKTEKAKPLDGLDVWNLICEGAASPRNEIVYNVEPFRAAVRQGDWKLHWLALLPGKLELFNLVQDISETTNLAIQNPEKVEALKARIQALAGEAKEPLLVMEALQKTFFTKPSTPEYLFQNPD